MNEAATSLPIVERSDHDLTLDEAAYLAGRSPKTLRRAVRSGELPRRYILGPRGPQLVFESAALRAWISARIPFGHTPAAHHEPHAQVGTGDVAHLVATVAQLHRALADNRTMLAQLAIRLRDQDGTVAQTQVTIAHLARKLAESAASGTPNSVRKGASAP